MEKVQLKPIFHLDKVREKQNCLTITKTEVLDERCGRRKGMIC